MQVTGNGIVCEERGRAGLVRLTRPNALNAISFEVIEALETFTHACAKAPHISGIVMEAEGKAFSAGGDIRAIYDWIDNDLPRARRYYAAEYQHIWTLQCFRKPHAALIDGLVMGGGVGVCLYGTHRVAGEAMRFAMPETGIGFFPDIGAAFFLSRLPDGIGLYLALTGTSVNAADAYALGLVTHCVRAERFETVRNAMADGEPPDPVLDSLHETPLQPSTLTPLRGAIARLFRGLSLADIVSNLETERGDDEAFARDTLNILAARSPLSLAVTFEHLKRGRSYRTLKDALIVDYRLACRFLDYPDFREGIRAAVIDKDRSPGWQAASPGVIVPSMVEDMFKPPDDGDLQLFDYWLPPGYR